jgi:hypothetical protein
MVMDLNSVLLAGLVSIGLLTIGLDGAFAGGRGGHYCSARTPGGIATTSGPRLAHTPANQAWERNKAWANSTVQLRQTPGASISSGSSRPALQHNAPTR